MNQDHSKGIAFKNFRRFPEFSMLEFGEITYMVGRNNSGKSTMVKALLLVLDYLKNQLSDTFSFDNQALEDANIVTFGRAKCNFIDEPEIVFNLKLGDYNITLNISGNDDQTRANVNVLIITDDWNGYELVINYDTQRTRIIKKLPRRDQILDTQQELTKLVAEIQKLEGALKNITKKGSKEALQISDQLNKLRDRRNRLAHNEEIREAEDDLEYSLEYPINYQDENFDEDLHDEFFDQTDVYNTEEHLDELSALDEAEENSVPRSEDNELKEIVSVLLYYNNIAYKQAIELRDKFADEYEFNQDIVELDNNKEDLKDWIDEIVSTIERESFYYLGANPSKQSALFQLRDKNNALAQAIHEFKQLDIGESTEEGMFVKKWMREFEVGHSYIIDFYAGEAYQFHVIGENKTVNHLSDKGMGSLQAMLLILRVASLIRISKKSDNTITLLIEEPELNLHPALQSKLTNFFHEVNREYGFKFIIETHSEYMIRKAQLYSIEEDYAKNLEVNPNPFKIFYFHKEEGHYEMEFTEQGKFKKDFGPGFYNEASNISIEIIKNIRKIKS
ncbi:hypothetical protein BTO09_06505 [Gilvibacter sp. SZ-19]|uniref:AAA family ATPase n=1 Tax=Gilvibacter sp. SZ-19 TaxID=754429 RepID=UPI000B3CCC2B|nr:AAA family ATPase [Gilvibacter sp. SZ-19]ARV12018.1 hypothetical protein BTO09_06505 [Gilvibacter sp. SZ-19]